LFIIDTTPAPSVRHVRSPWSLRSGGPGFKSEHKNGSAEGAVYSSPASLPYHLYPHFTLLNPRA